MRELIEKLEKTNGPDRKLDIAIMYHEIDRGAGMRVARIAKLDETASFYTSSLDAAMSLFGGDVPRGLHLYRNSNPDMGGRDWVVSHQAPTTRVAARSWPLALCIAALKIQSTDDGTKTQSLPEPNPSTRSAS